jgi:hypothetical protein
MRMRTVGGTGMEDQDPEFSRPARDSASATALRTGNLGAGLDDELAQLW